MANNSAFASAKGWDFQRNAAILLFIENIKEAKSIKVEGSVEDIELYMMDGSYIYAQTKSVSDPEDFRNVIKNLKSALRTLNIAKNNSNCAKILYVTNSPNPFNKMSTMHAFVGHTNLSFTNLPSKCQKDIENIILKEKLEYLEKEDFNIKVFPFRTDDLKERYKTIEDEINKFIVNLDYRCRGHENIIMRIWQEDFFENCTKKEKKSIRALITEKTKSSHEVITEMYTIIYKYAVELKLDQQIDFKLEEVFTSDLKSLTGTILHKMVFIYQLAYILMVESKLNMKLPIILDSPSGREVKKEVIDLMVDILRRDFKDNQIILASINTYDLHNLKVFEIEDRLINEQQSY